MISVFRPRGNFAWAFVTWFLLSLFALNSITTQSDWVVILLEVLVSLVLAWCAYALWIRPKIRFEEEGLVVVNPLTSVSIRYEDIIDLRTKWALQIEHKHGVTTAWVAPAGGKRRWIANETMKTYGSSIPLSGETPQKTEAASASMNSLSGQAAYTIREIMKRRH